MSDKPSNRPEHRTSPITTDEVAREVRDFKARCFPRLDPGSAQDVDITICFLAGMVDSLFLIAKHRGSADGFEVDLMNAAQDLAKLANRGGLSGAN